MMRLEPNTDLVEPGVHLLMDERLIASRRNVSLCLGKPQKHPRGPLVVEDRAWECSGSNAYPNIVFDPAERLYKLWYTHFLDLRTHRAQSLCYAFSEDGLHWEKPELEILPWRDSPRTNILLPFISGAGVALDARAQSPDERFKMTYLIHPELAPEWAKELTAAGWPVSSRGLGVGFSPDGIHWKLRPDNPVQKLTGDTHNNWLWHEPTRRYVLTTRIYEPWADGRKRFQRFWRDGESRVLESWGERLVERWESEDFIHWTNPRVVFRADGDEVGRRQFYAMPVFPYGNGYLGLLAIFNSDAEDDTVDCELAWSPDTVQWQRVCRGESFIPRGSPGSPDVGTIYPGWSPLRIGDEVRIYYAGSVGTHGTGIHRRSSVLLATLPRDRFAGWCADGAGELVTRPIVCQGRFLVLNTDATRGQVRAEIRHPGGSPVDGLEFGQCDPVSGDAVRARVKWTGSRDLSALVGQPIQVALRFSEAALYTISFALV